MEITQKRKKFNALLHYANLEKAKESILAGYGVESTTELTEAQLNDAIERVTKLLEQSQTEQKIQEKNELKQWRHRCLKMIAQCGIDTTDWNNVNEFMLNPRICGKHMYELNVHELIILHRKLHNVKENKDKSNDDFKRLASLN